MRNISKGWKTTLLGIVFIVSGIGYLFLNQSPDSVVLSLIGGCGIGFLFSPDSVINVLKRKSKGL